MNKYHNRNFLLMLLAGFFFLAFNKEALLARGEHQIQVINYGHKFPEVPMDLMEANFYNIHHPGYVIRIENLNETLNREINQDINREYNEWFNAEYNRRRLLENSYAYPPEYYQGVDEYNQGAGEESQEEGSAE